MCKIVAMTTVVMTVTMLAPVVAIAQGADPSGITSLDPIAQLIDGFASGQAVDGLYLPTQTDEGPNGLTQFQMIINMGGAPNFGERGVSTLPAGFNSDGELVSLEDQFGGAGQFNSLIPPLAPFDRGRGMDLTPILDGWTAYGEEGLIEGPVEIFEEMQVVAGIALAEPYDRECTERTYVGRAWVGSTVSAPDPLFTAEALNDRYNDASHAVLAGRASRTIELECSPSSGPMVSSWRMKEDSGIQSFGPLGTIALVKGDHVVLFAPIRVLDGDVTQRFYSSAAEGGDIQLSEIDTTPKALLPNPYSPGDIAISISIDIPIRDGGGEEGAAPVIGNTHDLLFRPGTSSDFLAGTGGECFPDVVDLILLSATNFAGNGAFFARTQSTAGEGTSIGGNEGGEWSVTFSLPHGAENTLVIQQMGQTVEFSEPCIATGTWEASGGSLFPGGDTSSGDTSGTATDNGDETAGGQIGGDGQNTGGTGGVPWGPIGAAIILLGAAVATVYVRQRSGTKDCKPEKRAYAAAVAAYDKAKKAADAPSTTDSTPPIVYAATRRARTETRHMPTPRPIGMNKKPRLSKPNPGLMPPAKTWNSPSAKWMKPSKPKRLRPMFLNVPVRRSGSVRGRHQSCRAAVSRRPHPIRVATRRRRRGSSPTVGDTPERRCAEGETRTKVVSHKNFQVVGGPITFNLSGIAAWTSAYPNGINADALSDLGESTLLDMFADMDRWSDTKNIGASIPIDILTVQCVQEMVCSNNQWVNSGEVKRVEHRTAGTAKRITSRAHDAGAGLALVKNVNATVETLDDNAAQAAAHTCD